MSGLPADLVRAPPRSPDVSLPKPVHREAFAVLAP